MIQPVPVRDDLNEVFAAAGTPYISDFVQGNGMSMLVVFNRLRGHADQMRVTALTEAQITQLSTAFRQVGIEVRDIRDIDQLPYAPNIAMGNNTAPYGLIFDRRQKEAFTLRANPALSGLQPAASVPITLQSANDAYRAFTLLNLSRITLITKRAGLSRALRLTATAAH